MLGRGGSAILGPDGAYLAGPLYDEEGILYAELDPDVLRQERQRFDPAGHYHRPDVLTLTVTPNAWNASQRRTHRRPGARSASARQGRRERAIVGGYCRD